MHPQNTMVAIVQLVRISVCGTEGRGFEPHWPPLKISAKAEIFLFKRISLLGIISCSPAIHGMGLIPDYNVPRRLVYLFGIKF